MKWFKWLRKVPTQPMPVDDMDIEGTGEDLAGGALEPEEVEKIDEVG